MTTRLNKGERIALLVLWTGASVVGQYIFYTLGIGGVLISSMFRGVFSVVILALIWGSIGGIIGIIQRVILRQAGLSVKRWANWTAVGWAIGGSVVLGLGIEHWLFQQVVLGIAIGVMQWLPLRKSVHRAGWWIVANSIGMLINVPVAGWILGVQTGLVTGLTLIWIMNHPIQPVEVRTPSASIVAS